MRTDHAALKWLLSFRNPERQIARWIQRLQEYEFEIEHRSGRKHNNADALSRCCCLVQHYCKHCDHQETKERLATLDQAPTTNDEKIEPKACTVSLTPAESASTIDMSQYSQIQQEQMQDPDLKPILEWKEKSEERPKWSAISSYSPTTKHYWSQWKRLKMNGILHRLWESPCGDRVVPQLVLPRKMRKEV